MTMPVRGLVGAVGAARVQQRPEINQHGALRHCALRDFMGFRPPAARPFVAARHEQRRAVLRREIVDRPHAVDHRLPSRMLETEHQIVGMDELLRLARADLDGLASD